MADAVDAVPGVTMSEHPAVHQAVMLLQTLRAGAVEAWDTLQAWTPPADDPDALVVTLIREAQDAARRGDLHDAMHRLRLAAEPKWKHPDNCAAAYAAAMTGRAWPPIGA